MIFPDKGFKHFLYAVAVALCLTSAPAAVFAKNCVSIPNELTLRCTGEDCKAGILWRSDNEHQGEGKYHPIIEWSSDTPASQFEVVVVDDTGRQVAWPYPLGQGLFLSMKGDFSVRDDYGAQVNFSINNPAHQFGYGPLATLTTQSVSQNRFKFDSSQGRYSLYIMRLGGEAFEGQMVPNVPRLWLTVRATGSNPGTYRLHNSNAKDGIVCESGSISLVSPCSLQVDPTTITFDNMRPRGSAKKLEQVKQSSVIVRCDSGESHNAYLRVWPAKIAAGNNTWANFKHKNGTDFRGLALIHKINKRPQNCDDGDVWGDTSELGKTKDSVARGDIYWGLCRTLSTTDVGDYSTTAVVYFWVD